MSSRLNKKAYKIIAAEITKAAAKDEIAGEISQKIALKRLRLLRSKKGKPVTEAELNYLISDLFPVKQKTLTRKLLTKRFALIALLVAFGYYPNLLWDWEV